MQFPKVKSHEGKLLQLQGLAGGSRADASQRRFHKAMTLQEAKSIARHLGLTLRQVRSGKYRVNFRDGDETTAHYTDNLENAVNTAVEMARKREL
jgi:L-ribulose-5-phosphate 3-epimerase UlaE